MKKYVKLLWSLFFLCALSFLFAACDKNAAFTVQYIAGEGGYIDGLTYQKVFGGEDALAVMAVPNEGFAFVGWEDGCAERVRTDQNVTGNVTVKAVFQKQKFSLTYVSGEGGRVEGELTQSVPYLENGTKVKAIAFEGYYFVKWSDGNEVAERRENAVSHPYTLTAEFAKECHVRYTAGEGGSVTGSLTQTLKQGIASDPVTAVADEGYTFVKWSDGVRTATRLEKSVYGDINVTAEFEKKTFTVTYTVGEGGEIVGEAQQTVKWGEDAKAVTVAVEDGCTFLGWKDGGQSVTRQERNVTQNIIAEAQIQTTNFSVAYTVDDSILGGGGTLDYLKDTPWAKRVKAVPFSNYVFLAWSDGVLEEERYDVYTSDFSVTAYFGLSVEYRVNENRGGEIVGGTYQKALPAQSFRQVTAVPYEGYAFAGWSDLSGNPVRKDTAYFAHDLYVAFFEPIAKTFRYDYTLASGMPEQTTVTLTRNSLPATVFAQPQFTGYTFAGWYADGDFRLKVADENGVYMLGSYGLSLATDTLYARWIKDGEEQGTVRKILLVFPERIRMTDEKNVPVNEIDYRMTAVEQQICVQLIALPLQTFLNDALQGAVQGVRVEADVYLATETLGDTDLNGYHLYGDTLATVAALQAGYDHVITSVLLSAANTPWGDGLSFRGKFASTAWQQWDYYAKFYCREEEIFEPIKHEYLYRYLKTFVSVAEQPYASDGEYLTYSKIYDGRELSEEEELQSIRDYLSGNAEAGGVKVGLPQEYWRENA